jgi:uncharacterized membrane protein YeaQ/YmgE (transglycosylase-associated protein family)
MAVKRPSNLLSPDYPCGTCKALTRRKAVGLLSWIAVGAIVGLVARRIVPGPDPGRFIVTILLGLAGASLGGLFTGVLGSTGARDFNLWSVLVATVSALGLLYLFAWITRRTA